MADRHKTIYLYMEPGQNATQSFFNNSQKLSQRFCMFSAKHHALAHFFTYFSLGKRFIETFSYNLKKTTPKQLASWYRKYLQIHGEPHCITELKLNKFEHSFNQDLNSNIYGA